MNSQDIKIYLNQIDIRNYDIYLGCECGCDSHIASQINNKTLC